MPAVTSRDRIRACMKRTCADRIPIGLIVGPFRARIIGSSLGDYFQDPRKLADSAVVSYELFRHDTVDVGWDIMMEAETAGAAMEFSDDSIPQVRKSVLGDKSALSTLALPDPEKSGRFPRYIEACGDVARRLKEPALSATVTGPWTTATGLRGAEQLILDTVDDPAFVEKLMDFTTEVVKILGSRVLETGIGLTMGEAASSCSLISPAIYRRFIKPRHQEIVRYFAEKKAGFSMHVCGYVDPIMGDILDLGIKALSMDSPSSLRKMVELSQKKIAIIGNVAPALFVSGTREEIENSVKECIRIAAPGGAYIISSGCELPYDASLERAQWYMEAAKEYGKAENIPGLR